MSGCMAELSRNYRASLFGRFYELIQLDTFPPGCFSMLRWLSAAIFIMMIPGVVLANGYGESAPWQFPTATQKSVNIAAVDMMERKKGGYYDGFTTTVYSSTITNVGTQINCSNSADANGNIANNSQGGNSAQLDADATINSTSVANDSLTGTDSGTGSSDTTQSNSGELSSSVTESNVETATGGIVNGETDNDLSNTQDNSGNQTASVSDSIACDMDGSTLTGNVDGNFSGQQLNAPLN